MCRKTRIVADPAYLGPMIFWSSSKAEPELCFIRKLSLPSVQARSQGEILPLLITWALPVNLVVFWYLVFEMGSVTPDKATLISVVVESLLYGSLPSSSKFRSITNKLGSGIFTVMFGFTLWVIIHERSGRINMKLLLPSLALYVLATAVSQLMESMPRIIHLTLDYVSIWPTMHIELWSHLPCTETHPVALLLISTIYQGRATSSDLHFTFYKLCWVISAW